MLQLGDPAASHPFGVLAAIRSAVCQVQELLNVGEAEAELLGTFDESHHPHRVGAVCPITGSGSFRLR